MGDGMGDQEKRAWAERWGFCELYGVPRIAVRRWINQGKLPAKRDGNLWLIDLQTALDLAERREQDKRTRQDSRRVT